MKHYYDQVFGVMIETTLFNLEKETQKSKNHMYGNSLSYAKLKFKICKKKKDNLIALFI